ncbi:H(+)/Cl(-) exchange transporter ClcA [Cronobacter sakazakii 680]|nr:H(+)/Cl(-) exchange transporter ClcA [Cronobacter sakazakii 680]
MRGLNAFRRTVRMTPQTTPNRRVRGFQHAAVIRQLLSRDKRR